MAKDKNITLEALTNALDNNELVFFYQPIISLVTGKPCGVEALIRWLHADGSIISPSMFIPLAEESGIITRITRTMLPKLLTDLKAIHQVDPTLMVALNVSTQDLTVSDFAENVLLEIQNHQTSLNNFSIEITESQSLVLNDRIRKVLVALDNVGVQIVLDDFGTGYSSISLIRDIPVIMVKIDQRFVVEVFAVEKSSQIVRHSIGLAHQLGMETIAEGVESQAVFDFLLCFGATKAQGYYFSPPLPLTDLLSYLSKNPCYLHVPPLGLIHLAQQDHVDWRRDFVREILNIIAEQDEKTRQQAYDRLPCLDPNECLFGKWYSKEGQRFRGTLLFEQLGFAHRELHELANRIVIATRQQTPRERVIESIWHLQKHSYELIRLLSELHTIAALEYKNMKPF